MAPAHIWMVRLLLATVVWSGVSWAGDRCATPYAAGDPGTPSVSLPGLVDPGHADDSGTPCPDHCGHAQAHLVGVVAAAPVAATAPSYRPFAMPTAALLSRSTSPLLQPPSV